MTGATTVMYCRFQSIHFVLWVRQYSIGLPSCFTSLGSNDRPAHTQEDLGDGRIFQTGVHTCRDESSLPSPSTPAQYTVYTAAGRERYRERMSDTGWGYTKREREKWVGLRREESNIVDYIVRPWDKHLLPLAGAGLERQSKCAQEF